MGAPISRSILTIAMLVMAMQFIAAGQCQAETDLDRVTTNLRASLLESAPWPTKSYKATDDFATLRADGSWPDQDYTDRDRVHWKAIDHLPRLLTIVRAYYTAGDPLAGKPVVLARSLASLKFWLDKDPKNENWWHNEIGVPRLVGEILMVLGNDAPADLRLHGIELMKRANWQKQTGANLTDETRIQVMRGCLSRSPELIAQAYERSWQEVRLAGANEDGMQLDHSFHQHGPLLYCQGYGIVFVEDIVQFVRYAQGTQYQIPAGPRDLFDDYLAGGPIWMMRGGKWDFGNCGRGICRPKNLEGSLETTFQTMAQVPGSTAAQMQMIANRLKDKDDESQPIGNRQFWLSDYMVHRRANYFASARMYSDRTLNTDGFINGENRKSHHMADGATCLMVSGNEYFNIFPVWDWLRIPGTTIEQQTPLDPKEVSHLGKNQLAGEVSDGNYGCSSMQLITGPLRALKSWFFFDHELVCLGTDINCPTSNHVFTSLNQCLLHGSVESSIGQLPAGDRELKQANWIWHDSIGYVLPAATNLHLKNQTQTGTWAEIGSGSDKPVSENVFGLWIDHGSQVSDGSYAYVIVPGSTAEQTAAEAAHLPVKILSNTPAVQAVWHEELNLMEAAFHQPGQLKFGTMKLSVNQPCLVLLKRDGDKLQLTVSNPRHAGGNVDVLLNTRLQGDGISTDNRGSVVHITLPDGLSAGSSVVREFTVSN